MLALIELLNLGFQLLNLLILARIIMSWVPGLSPYHRAVRTVHLLTSPILDPLRRLMPPVGGLDLSPVIAILLLYLVRNLLVQALLAI